MFGFLDCLFSRLIILSLWSSQLNQWRKEWTFSVWNQTNYLSNVDNNWSQKSQIEGWSLLQTRWKITLMFVCEWDLCRYLEGVGGLLRYLFLIPVTSSQLQKSQMLIRWWLGQLYGVLLPLVDIIITWLNIRLLLNIFGSIKSGGDISEIISEISILIF